MLRPLIALGAAAALTFAVGCGEKKETLGSTDASTQATQVDTNTITDAEPATPSKKRRRGTRIRVVRSQFGRVVADRKGEALYLFDKETGKRPQCYGECARAWPPVLTKGKPRAFKGARARLLGTTRRRNGKKQVTYRGHPLYYYVSDAPGRILCQDVEEFGGTWLVVKPSGRPVT